MEFIRKFVSFGFVGAFATLIHYLIFIVFVAGGIAEPVAASAIGFGISALVNYALNYRFTFRSQKNHIAVLPKFALISLSGLVLNTLIIATLLYKFSWHYLLSQVMSTGIVLLWNFTLNHVWSFRESAKL